MKSKLLASAGAMVLTMMGCQAHATMFLLVVSGVGTGTTITQDVCGTGICSALQNYTKPVSASFVVFDPVPFTTLNLTSGSFISLPGADFATIFYSGNDTFSALSLNHSYLNVACQGPGVVGLCSDSYSASSLSIRDLYAPAPPVPEPTTWTMLLAGFSAIGWAMRRRQNMEVSFA